MSFRNAFALLVTAALAAPVLADAATPADDGSAATIRRGDAYAHLVAAGLAVSRGRGADAAREIGEAVALEPGSAALHSQGASLLAMLGRRAEAERLARQALTLDAHQTEAVRVLADLAASRSFGPKADPAARTEAIRLYERLTLEDPKAPDEIWAALAKLKLSAGDHDGAVADAKKYLARRPGDETALRLLDQALVASGGTKEALATTLAWIKAHPDDSDDLLPLVVEMARETGEWSLIESMLDGLIAANPENARARALRGEARLRQGRAKEALEDLELARAASPRDPMVRLHIAAAYQAENRLADATQIAESLASEYPDNTFVRLLLAETLARRGETATARDEYAAALRGLAGDDPDDVARRDEVRLRIAAIDLAAKRSDDAKAMLGTLEKPDATPALAVRARAALLARDAREAKRLAKLLGAVEPGDGALIDGEAELTLGRNSRANERFEAAVAKGGPQARGDVAAILRRNGRDADAERQLRAWVTAAPEDAEGRLALGAWLDRAGRLAEGETELREAMRLDPRSAEAFNYLGYSLADRGERLEEAVELIRKALVIDPWNGAYLDSLGWAYVKLGRLDEAREPLERAVREFPRDPTVLEHLGDYFSRSGDQGRARTFWQRAMEAGPETPEAKDGLQKKLDAARPAVGPPENQTAVVVPGS
ncbi:MAG TPA: tetratricopeptide repeat protein [Candidatus Polarisedimenticolaceae bacterium]|nr:tetratricopeptide repeat protein [Candidatus Polarisedimenticolaceae bacterium]